VERIKNTKVSLRKSKTKTAEMTIILFFLEESKLAVGTVVGVCGTVLETITWDITGTVSSLTALFTDSVSGNCYSEVEISASKPSAKFIYKEKVI